MKKRMLRLFALVMAVTLLATFAGCRKNPEQSSGEWLSEKDYYYYDASGNWVQVADPSIFENNGTTDGDNTATDGDNANNSTTGGNSSSLGKPVDSSAYQTLIDYCGTDKYEKVFEHENITIDDLYSDVLEDDCRFRKFNGNKDAYLTYKIDGIAEFFVEYSYGIDKNYKKTDNLITFLVSKDNKNWTEVQPQDMLCQQFNGTSWQRYRCYFGDIDPANKYLKIAIGKEGTIVYQPNINTVQINGLTKEALANLGMYNSKIAPTTIYVDSKNGKDTNSGTSEKEPLKTLYGASKRIYSPGSKILLKAGCEFSGSLEIIGSGAAKRPITVTSYGKGAKPVINARGGAAITAYGEYLTFTGLKITNKSGKSGISMTSTRPGANRGITITKCDFENINVNFNYTDKGSGGIMLTASGREPAWYDGITITDNTFNHVARCGIVIGSDWTGKVYNQEWGNKNDIKKGEWYGNKNVIVRNNNLNEIGGDGILLMGCDAGLVEKNVVTNSGLFKNAGQIHWVAIWCHSCNDCIFQYNEVYNNSGKNNGHDLQAYDADIANERCIFQYNYSYENEGGAMLFCTNDEKDNAQTVDTYYRFNLSVNDGTEGGKIIDVTGSCWNSYVYNNTIYNNKYNQKLVNLCSYDGSTPSKNTVFMNNIFYADGVEMTYDFGNFRSATFDTNVFKGIPVPTASKKVTVKNCITDNFELVEAGFIKNVGLEKIAAKYKPKTDFLTKKGTTIKNNPSKDMLGKKVPSTLLGALAK